MTSANFSPPGPVLVAGIGNPDRGDDGFGPAVIARLAELALPNVEVIGCRRPLDLLDRWPGRPLAIVADAAVSRREPGTLLRLEPLSEGVPRSDAASTHGLGLAEAIGLGRSLGRLPARLVLYIAEASSFGHRTPLSPPLLAAVEEAVRRIAEECVGPDATLSLQRRRSMP